MSSASFYKWRAKFGGMDASLMKEMKELRAENARLKKMYAEERLKAEIRQEVIEGKYLRHLFAKRWLSKSSLIVLSVLALLAFVLGLAKPAFGTSRNYPARMQ